MFGTKRRGTKWEWVEVMGGEELVDLSLLLGWI
jgi:hypothetical protein